MIYSMTGFGKNEILLSDKKIIVEIRSVNSKQLDLNLKMPYIYKEKEIEIRNLISELLDRGKVDVYITEEHLGVVKKQVVNKELAVLYYKELKELALELGEDDTRVFPMIFKMPDVIQNETKEFDEDSYKFLIKCVRISLDELNKYRKQEGKVLEKDLLLRIELIEECLIKISDFESIRLENVKKRINDHLQSVLSDENIDRNRFEQELIYYIEKYDITEEKVRLQAHCNYFKENLKEKNNLKGKKLGFITQEIGREINTIGSKSNQVDMQQLVVQMKDELEKVKEQLLNVL